MKINMQKDWEIMRFNNNYRRSSRNGRPVHRSALRKLFIIATKTATRWNHYTRIVIWWIYALQCYTYNIWTMHAIRLYFVLHTVVCSRRLFQVFLMASIFRDVPAPLGLFLHPSYTHTKITKIRMWMESSWNESWRQVVVLCCFLSVSRAWQSVKCIWMWKHGFFFNNMHFDGLFTEYPCAGMFIQSLFGSEYDTNTHTYICESNCLPCHTLSYQI